MDGFSVGAVRVRRVEEWQDEFTPPEYLFDRFDAAAFDAHLAEFEPDYVRNGHVYGFLQSWLIEAGDKRILYDTGAGNDKDRPAIPIFGNLSSDFLGHLRSAGAEPGDIDLVICSHLHIDHVGWNTCKDGGAWVPTFPNARYLLPAIDRDFWDPADEARYAQARGAEVNRNVFEDSVQPILDAGLAVLVGDGFDVAAGITLHAAPGHTPGHLFLRVESEGEVALFVGDIMHHPIQVHRPDWNSVYCEDPDQAARTRHRVLNLAVDQHARVVPAHFGGVHSVFVERTADGFRPIYGDIPASALG